MRRRGLVVLLASVVSFVATTMLSAAPAAAWDSTCVVAAYGDNCTFWGQSYNGARGGDPGWVPDFNALRYPNNGTGAGQVVGNNNGSNRNVDTVCSVQLWYNPNYTGPVVVLNRYGTGVYQRAGSQLGTLLNNLRSQKWSC